MKIKNELRLSLYSILFVIFLVFASFNLNSTISLAETSQETKSEISAVPDAYEDDNDFTSAKSIALNTLQSRSISSIDDVDYVRFFLDSFYDVGIEITGLSGDTRMWLFDSSRLQIAYDDDGGINQFSMINPVFLRPGDYYIKIDEFGNDNTLDGYNLSVSATITTDFYESDDIPANCIPLLLNSLTQRSLYPSGDWDYFSFTIFNTYNITLEISGTDGDTEMWLFWDPADEVISNIDYDDDGGDGGFSKIVQNNLSPGSYYVRISEYGDNSDVLNYTLSLIAHSDSIADNEGPDISFIETYPFILLSSSEILIIASVSDPSGVKSVNLNYNLNDGPWYTTEMIYDSAQDYGIVIGPYEVEDNITYYISAHDNSTGNYFSIDDNDEEYYSFIVDSLDPLDPMEKDDSLVYAGTISLNSTIDRRIYPVLDVDYCTFELFEEYNVEIETSGTSGDSVLYLYDENLTLLAINDNSGVDSFSKITIILESGVYIVKIVENGYDEVIPEYNVTLLAYEIVQIPEYNFKVVLTLTSIYVVLILMFNKSLKRKKK
ncbi:MAG: PPC domain-containing protein [Candidatus Heimdallarchaeaceae archaeon]